MRAGKPDPPNPMGHHVRRLQRTLQAWAPGPLSPFAKHVPRQPNAIPLASYARPQEAPHGLSAIIVRADALNGSTTLSQYPA